MAAPLRLFTGRLAYWAVRYELLSVSARDEYDGPDFLVARALGDFRTIRYRLGYGHQLMRPRLLIGMIKVGSSPNPAPALRTHGGHGQLRFGSNKTKYLKYMVPQTGLEPVTPSLRMTCSTN